MQFRGFKILLDGNDQRTMATVIDPEGEHKRSTFIRPTRREAINAANALIIKRTKRRSSSTSFR